MVEHRLAKARAAGSNPVSCFLNYRKESLIYQGFFFLFIIENGNGCNESKNGGFKIMFFVDHISRSAFKNFSL